MIHADFVLYRFVCDSSTFTGLFAEDGQGRRIPEAASFQCTWGRTPRALPSSREKGAAHYQIDGATEETPFKILGSDMALTFATHQHQLTLSDAKDVITFALRPSVYSAPGPLPLIAKGTLDPNPYCDKPKKNYAIKLRDAAGVVTGKLLFSLRVHKVDDELSDRERSPPATAPALGGGEGQPGTPPAFQRNPSRDRVLKTTLQAVAAVAFPLAGSASPSGELFAPKTLPMTTQSPNIPYPQGKAPPESAQGTALRGEEPPIPQQNECSGWRIDIQLERVTVKSESIDLDHPAPLLLGGDYKMKIRYGAYSFNTGRAVCCSPKEVVYDSQQACVTLRPLGNPEKLRFSLWEDAKQVAGFSLDPAKFTAEAGQWKEYAIPFRYHPTGQRAVLEVRVCREMIPGYTPMPQAIPALPSKVANTLLTKVPLTPPQGAGCADQWDGVAHREGQTSTSLRTVSCTDIRKKESTQASRDVNQPPPRLPTPSSLQDALLPESLVPTAAPSEGALLPQDAWRTSTPLRTHRSVAHDAAEGGQGYRDTHRREGAGVAGGWKRTPIPQRPPPLTENLADAPADRRQPDEHEKYIAEVLTRLGNQRRGARQQNSLMEEWMEWRDSREHSRSNSVTSAHVRSASVSSVASRADSIASVVSRRASLPQPTKSNADHSLMSPFTPAPSVYPQRRPSSSPVACRPLIGF